MNPHDRYLLAIIHELQPNATYAGISMRSRSPNYFLGPKLDDLINRGFVLIKDSRYRLAHGVKESVLGIR